MVKSFRHPPHGLWWRGGDPWFGSRAVERVDLDPVGIDRFNGVVQCREGLLVSLHPGTTNISSQISASDSFRRSASPPMIPAISSDGWGRLIREKGAGVAASREGMMTSIPSVIARTSGSRKRLPFVRRAIRYSGNDSRRWMVMRPRPEWRVGSPDPE